MRELSRQEARDFLVKYHMINTNTTLSKKDGVLDVMRRLNSIQYDPLDVVGKNIDLVMQARVPDYTRSLINEMLYQDRTLIDGWDKMMDLVRKERFDAHYFTLKYRLQLDALNIMDEVYEYLKENGPKYSSEFKIGESIKGPWGSTKMSAAALDCLYFKGDIGVRERRNTQKQYDIMENLIGDLATAPSPFSTEEEFIEYYLLRRIQACGLFRNKNGVHASGTFISKKKTREDYFPKLIEKGLIEAVRIEGIKETVYRPIINLDEELIDQVTIIAPLDNMIWDRDLIENLFNFRYRWEVYTPVVKREYGYYVLPLVHKSNFIGRIEFKKHRRKEKLEIINTWIEAGVEETKELHNLIQNAIERFTQYLLG